MWKVVLGIPLSLLPRRWRGARAIPEETVPWVPAAILSGILESVLAVAGLIYWYSHSVTTWAADALDSALRNGPGAEYDPHLLGLSAFVVWCIHPLTWLLASFFGEGLVRIVGAISIEQILPMWLLAFADWCYGRFTHRAPEGDLCTSLKERTNSLFLAGREGRGEDHWSARNCPTNLSKSLTAAIPSSAILCSRPKAEWIHRSCAYRGHLLPTRVHGRGQAAADPSFIDCAGSRRECPDATCCFTNRPSSQPVKPS
jgi:hypothetical protein